MTKPAILSTITGDSARARTSDPTTSHEAADSISAAALEDSEREVLTIVRKAEAPVCAEQIEERHLRRFWQGDTADHWKPSRLRTALKQLVDAGAIVQQGETLTDSGRHARAWVAVDADDDAVARWLAIARERRLTAQAERRGLRAMRFAGIH